MKRKIYHLDCWDCSQELVEGTLLEIKSWVKNQFMDWDSVEYECDDLYLTQCTDCTRLMS